MNLCGKELAHQIVDNIPNTQMTYLINMLQNFQMAIAEAEDDAFCEKMYNDYLSDTDPEKDDTISIEDLAKELGVLLWPTK